jgi:alkane 1-monooxygenase
VLEKVLGNILLLNVNYMHWGNEHLDGHHDQVATPEDSATSRMDESLYHFLPRTYFGTYWSAWKLELKRIEREGGSKLLNNRMIAYALAPLAWGALLAKATGGGAKALGMFYAQGLGGSLILEMVNYIEHYGLVRDKLEDGSYEPVQPVHSWNAPQRLSNAFLFKLQRHSDHHSFASRPYHLLRVYDESPQMPSGYPGMLSLALFPPIWRWIMNPLVRASKVKRADNGEGFVKDDEWVQAERTAKLKFAGFAVAWFALATYGLRRALKAAHRSAQAVAS